MDTAKNKQPFPLRLVVGEREYQRSSGTARRSSYETMRAVTLDCEHEIEGTASEIPPPTIGETRMRCWHCCRGSKSTPAPRLMELGLSALLDRLEHNATEIVCRIDADRNTDKAEAEAKRKRIRAEISFRTEETSRDKRVNRKLLDAIGLLDESQGHHGEFASDKVGEAIGILRSLLEPR